MKDGFVKVAAASPVIRLADCEYNAGLVVDAIRGAAEKGVKILVFPELTLTGATCGDLLGHRVLLDGAARALEKVVEASEGVDMLIFVGLPFAFGAKLLSVAAVVYDGGILGLVPREDVSGTPFSVYEGEGDFVRIGPYESCLCPNTLFTHASLEGLAVAVELGSDSNEPVSPQVRAGARRARPGREHDRQQLFRSLPRGRERRAACLGRAGGQSRGQRDRRAVSAHAAPPRRRLRSAR